MPNVLIVDDSPIERRLAAGVLCCDDSWHIVEASDVQEAVFLAESTPLDLVLTDARMPGGDGLELLQRIKSAQPLIPVIMMTGYGSEELAVQALQAGADGYITKDKLSRDLCDVVERVLNIAQENRSRATVLEMYSHQVISLVMESNPQHAGHVVRHLVDQCSDFGIIGPSDRIRLTVAFEEALLNAVIHGNLEVTSDLRELADGSFERLVRERQETPPYCDRRIYITCTLTPEEARVVIRDEGAGFDVSSIPDPREPERMMIASGRGLFLMRTFLDKVMFNAFGNEVTLVKWRGPRCEHEAECEDLLCAAH
jgi:CheY-like chemotaxis protein/anti-sigma regulatory factor (Ser/Thr protein kinase)